MGRNKIMFVGLITGVSRLRVDMILQVNMHRIEMTYGSSILVKTILKPQERT